MKKKNLLYLFILFAGVMQAQSPSFNWVKTTKGSDVIENDLYSNKVDQSNNVFVAGTFTGSIDFDPGVGVVNLSTPVNNYHTFIQKFDSMGVLLWAKSFGNSRMKSMTLDSDDNILIVGDFTGTTDVDPGAGVNNLVSVGFEDVFIVKLDNDGNFLWGKSVGGTNYDRAHSVATDTIGNVYVAGSYRLTVDFDPGAATFNLTSAGAHDIFIQKLDVNGDFVLAKSMGGPSNDYPNSIAVDNGGNIYITGKYYGDDSFGSADFDPDAGVYLLPNNSSFDVYAQKLDASGGLVWAYSYGAVGSDEPGSITVDNNGSVYVTGSFLYTVNFDPNGNQNETAAGGRDVFVLKLSEGGNFTWVKTIGSGSHDDAKSISVDGDGNVFVSGAFQNTIDFDPGVGVVNRTSHGAEDAFIEKLDVNGDFVWAHTFGGTSKDRAISLALSQSNMVYVSGDFMNNVNFDENGAGANETSVHTYDIFLLKLGDPIPTGIAAINVIDNNDLSISPNPSNNGIFNLNWSEIVNYKGLTVVNVLGEEVFNMALNSTYSKYELNLSMLNQGVYYVTFYNEVNKSTSRLVIAK